MFESPLIVLETDPSRSLGLLLACVERPCDGPAAKECDEFAPSRAKLPAAFGSFATVFRFPMEARPSYSLNKMRTRSRRKAHS
jgi:hypothetical protein